jgi:NADPH-dependent 2,4-dienoyl-CoA reductase/sulfur reductase-like enzyme
MQADLAIVGAGPAGLSAAVSAVSAGLKVVVLDEQPVPGGQIYRNIETLAAKRPAHLQWLGPDYAAGLPLLRAFRDSGAGYLPQAQVWQVGHDGRVYYRRNLGHEGAVGILHAQKVLIATGAMERPLPVPGWTLPGVMSCGAGQTLLKASGLAPEGRVVLAGCGPLLLLLAAQLIRAGRPPAALLETSYDLWRALPHLPGMLGLPAYLLKGLGLLREIRAAGVPFHRGVSRLAIHGPGRAREVGFESGGRSQRIAADWVFLHQGVVPNGNLALSTDIRHRWDEGQRCFHPQLDEAGRSSSATISVAGDAGGIVGALGAAAMGELAGLAIAADLGRIDAAILAQRSAAAQRVLRRHRAARPFLDRLYQPGRSWLAPSDPDTVICRCEEIRAGEVRNVVAAQNCPGPNQLKSFLRCGMGPCQGRLCGLTAVELIAETRGQSPAETGYYRIRSPIKPVTLGDMAALDVPSRHDAVNP